MNVANRLLRPIALACGATVMLALVAPSPAAAEGQSKSRPSNPDWQQECGSCHVAYPPRLLSADSWRRIMASLGRHFGVDASLEPAQSAAIESFLVANARRPRPESDPPAAEAPLRITETRWFVSEHRRIAEAKWRSDAVGSASNCAACHLKAEQGSFSERDIRVP